MTQEVAVGSAAALACYLLFFAVSLLFFRRQPADARDTLRFAAVYGNIGFMGLPLVQSILGEEALVYGALALLAFNLTSWTLGVLIMGGRAAFSLRRAVLNPGVIGIGLGLLCFLSGLRFPSPVGAALSFLSDLNTPLAWWSSVPSSPKPTCPAPSANPGTTWFPSCAWPCSPP